MDIKLPPDGVLRAITIHEPSATLTVQGLKTIENRGFMLPKDWPLPVTMAVHASKSTAVLEDESFLDSIFHDDAVYDALNNPHAEKVPGKAMFYGSAIIGLVDVVAIVPMPADTRDNTDVYEYFDRWPTKEPAAHQRRGAWAFGSKCWILDNPRRFKRGYATRGYQRYWRVPAKIQQHIIERAELADNISDLPSIPHEVDGPVVVLQ